MTEPVDKQYKKWLHGHLRLGNEFAAADLINGKVDEAVPNQANSADAKSRAAD